ncbi:MAG: prephenate dehydratase [Methanobrevibacter sp.]|uniref:prephenate dehydratase n=1 Tax=uncultured Methanobrevibacter sp. TaxID=253161 RepID=UPI0025E43599|nr:prephenate dehydratase [uncultured Methanobrevibacter sp.]MEE1129838.1 prephenate dehydratase [Methanobrevibacter sp.]
MTLISFLGPKGTFTHEAASLIGDELIPYCTIPAVMESVKNGDCSLGVVPIENSIEGPVGITLDQLAHKYDLKIFKEIIIPINQNLIVNPGTKMEDIEDVYSHAQAIAQCQDYIRNHGIQPHYAVSTARAAKSIIGEKSKAAICNAKVVELYGLEILESNIQDIANNETRFVVLSKESPKMTGRDKTSIIFSIYEDRPGGLYNILGIFEKNNINLTKIESRPSKEGLGKYLFFVDFNGHIDDNLIQNILKEIEDNTYFLKVLGSYPEF